MPTERGYNPFARLRDEMPRPPVNVQDPVTKEPVEEFRQTGEMRGFQKMYKQMLRITDFLQRGVMGAAEEFQRRRNLFGDAVGSLGVLGNRIPSIQRRISELSGQYGGAPPLSPTFEEASAEVPQRAQQRSEEAPFGLRGIMTTLGEHGEISERAYRQRR